MKLTSFVGSSIYSIYECTYVGTIYSVHLNKTNNKILGFYLFDNNDTEYYLPLKNINGHDKYITINNLDKITTIFSPNTFNLIGKKVISLTGEDLGQISDMDFNENGYIDNIYCLQNKIPLSSIIFSGNVVFVGEKTNLKKYKPRFIPKIKSTSIDNDFTIKIMEHESQISNKQQTPPKITYNSISLLGKKVKSDLIGLNNELLIKRNQIITEKQIELAKQHNKLNQLFYSCN